MPHKLINLNPDLKQLKTEGYEIQIKNNHLIVSHIPYVNSNRVICYGVFVSTLELAGDKTVRPQHVMSFIGEYPCNNDGSPIEGIRYQDVSTNLGNGIQIDRSFSNKPTDGYKDYFDKVSTYEKIISGPAASIDDSVTAKTFLPVESDDTENSVFIYEDTNSSRAAIDAISSKLFNQKIAIIGLGGTGSYILDFISKTPVKEIHLFDGDEFLTHNAFRTPGAASFEKLKKRPKKVVYLNEIYSNMHKGITPHEHNILSTELDLLSGMNYVFICIDKGEIKKNITEKLVAEEIPFTDVGLGIEVVEGALRGSIRITSGDKIKNDHLNERISFSDNPDDDYKTNIQISELNALNAVLAVIRWKKYSGFYSESIKDYNTTYDLDTNKLMNDYVDT